jgi:glutamate racemase
VIGVFDSGVGGFASAKLLRTHFKNEDIVYLADRKNAPYGTKNERELLSIVSRDIKRLCNYGCRVCLIACCTASSVYPKLDEDLRDVSRPIIGAAARVASCGKKIAVIATAHTVKSQAFSREIARFSNSAVIEICAQELVSLVESGERDERLSKNGYETVFNISEKIKTTGSDTLVLGCTHFSHLEKTFKTLLPGVMIVNSAREGALGLCSEIKSEKRERGVSLYTE